MNGQAGMDKYRRDPRYLPVDTRRYWTCARKRQYPTEAAAHHALRMLLTRCPDLTGLMHVYPCLYGDHWHVGHARGLGNRQQEQNSRD